PLNTYGRTKLAGEKALQEVGGQYYIFRTSWLYSTRKPCFLSKVLDWARSQETIKVVDDQVGSPTWSRTLAEASAQAAARLLDRDLSWRESTSGIYHTAGIGAVSRYDWAQRILDLDPHPEQQVVSQVLRAHSADFETPAERPAFSALDCSRFQSTFDAFYTNWEQALEQALSLSEGQD
ncbi:MAG: SDR family oxidoreductase, partial [Anaerolineales bacterium]